MINAPHLFQFLRIFQYERRTWCKLSANLIFNTICDFFWQLPINMFFIKEKLPKQAFCNFSGFLLCFVFLGQYPQKMCYCDQNHHQQAIYLNFSNFLMIYQPKNNNENLSFSLGGTQLQYYLVQRCFPVNIAKFLIAQLLKNICKRLLYSVHQFDQNQC